MKNSKRYTISAIIITIAAIPTVTTLVVNSPDNIPPIINISTPNENQHLSGLIRITFTATDQQGIIQERQILLTEILRDSKSV